MSAGIFLIQDDNLVPMFETAYDSESVLQALLAKFPDLLAGDQFHPDAARRWLLIDREAGLPGEEDGAVRWSVDHLFIDQDAIPTLVEVKRSSDTRIRREVVGQMLDYAANAVVYWPVDGLRAIFERRCEREGLDPDTELSIVIGEDGDPGGYWEQVGVNLKAGRIRLVFVADSIPPELRRVVEFLNEQMTAEVIAIEVRQYVGEGLRTLVPRMVGQTAAAESRKSRTERQWDETSFLEELKVKRGPAEAQVARAIIDWARVTFPRFTWGKGKVVGSFIPVFDSGGQPYYPLAVYTDGRVEIQFQWLTRPPFDDLDLRRGFLQELNQVPGVSFAEEVITRRPSIGLSLLADQAAFESFTRAFDWFREQVQRG